MIEPPRWPTEKLEEDRARAIAIFRRERLEEPVGKYASALEEHRRIVDDLLRSTGELRSLDTEALLRILGDRRLLLAFRYLSGPPISEDDLKTLAEAASLAPSRLKDEPQTVARLAQVVLGCIDRRRFPWLSDGRQPTDPERDAALLASACLMAHQRIQAERRRSGKDRLEGAVKECLIDAGFVEVPRREVKLLSDAPGPGEFCAETSCAGRRADFVVGLWDGRHMLVECKDSNSLVNSIKRLNNDTAAKAVFWIRTFGQRAVVPAAVLSGVYYLDSLDRAQRDGLTLFWGHDMQRFTAWVHQARRSA
jgi:hypothetical protein